MNLAVGSHTKELLTFKVKVKWDRWAGAPCLWLDDAGPSILQPNKPKKIDAKEKKRKKKVFIYLQTIHTKRSRRLQNFGFPLSHSRHIFGSVSSSPVVIPS
jgi:hypothetical protein